MTQILSLPQISATFRVANNAGWYDAIAFKQADATTALDISNIRFKGSVRPTADSPIVLLEVDTNTGTLINGGTNGVLSWNVTPDETYQLTAGDYVLDLLAIADSKTVNLFQKAGPATLTVHQGVTR